MGECPCGFRYSRTPELAAHIADVMIRELANDDIRPALRDALASWGDDDSSNPPKLVECAYCDWVGTPEELTTQHLNGCP